MTDTTWWFVARATGMTACGLLFASVLCGLAVAGPRRRLSRAWTLDMHRFLSGAAVVFTALHVVSLVSDHYARIGLADALVPLHIRWRPGAVGWGITTLYLLVSIEVSSRLMRRLSRRAWRAIHLTSFILLATATAHAIRAGTDAHDAAFRVIAITASIAVAAMLAYRVATAFRSPSASDRLLSSVDPAQPPARPNKNEVSNRASTIDVIRTNVRSR